jgi:hypothetical protein
MDIARRAALLYSFALLLIATFVQLSGWSAIFNLIAAEALTFYFFAAVASYTLHGWRRNTDNRFRDPARAAHVFDDRFDRRRNRRLAGLDGGLP